MQRTKSFRCTALFRDI